MISRIHIVAMALAVIALLFWFGFGPAAHWVKEERFSPEERRQHMDQVMQNAQKIVSSAQITASNLEVRGDGPLPFAVYAVALVQSPAIETYLPFESERYVLDAGSDVKTGELCQTVKDATPQRIQELQSEALEGAQITLGVGIPPFEGGIQVPVGALFRDLARIMGVLAREPENSFEKLDIFVKGFADGDAAPWVRDVEDYPYDFHEIDILPQLDPQNSVTPHKFLRSPTKFLIGPTYSNDHLANLRAKFVAQDIVEPMLGGCLKGQPVSVSILEGYVSRRTIHNPMQRKVEVYLSFY
jgi:hypothetical protein